MADLHINSINNIPMRKRLRKSIMAMFVTSIYKGSPLLPYQVPIFAKVHQILSYANDCGKRQLS